MTQPLPERLRALKDIHTHRRENNPDALVSLLPEEAATFAANYPDTLFSAGIHPWEPFISTEDEDRRFATLTEALLLDNAAAIGETGLDSLKGPDATIQEARFRRHIALSEKLGLPLIIHIVKAQQQLLAIRKEVCPTQPWIIHGFRGKAQQASQLAKAGLYISFGEHFNPDALATVQASQRLAETDESTLPIDAITASHARTLSQTTF